MSIDRNGYLHPNLFGSEDGECYVCGVMGMCNRHEPLRGPDRQKSKHLGLWFHCCPPCHRRIHSNRQLELKYKQEAQRLYQEHYGDDFLNVFGKNYL